MLVTTQQLGMMNKVQEPEQPATVDAQAKSAVTSGEDPIAEEMREIAEADVTEEIEREITAQKENSVSLASAATTIRSWFQDKNVRYKLEALARDCVALIIASSVAIFGGGVLISNTMGTLLVLVVMTHTLMFPSLMWDMFAVWPGIVIFGFSIWIYTSIVLCAATVSDGLFVAVYAIVIFLMMATFFDSISKGVNRGIASVTGVYMALVGTLSWTYKHLVQDGPTFNFVPGDISGLDPYQIAFVEAASSLIDILPTTSESEISFVCPEETGPFSGQTCTITNSTSSGSLTASVNGGLYLVAAFWTERGINNPLAVVANFMIMYTWAYASIAVSVLLIPPVRKFRDLLRHIIIPDALGSVAELIELTFIAGDDGNSGEVDPFMEDREKLSLMASKISPKKNAEMVMFEPRPCHDPASDHIPHMKAFLQHIQSLELLLYNYRGLQKASGMAIPDFSNSVKVLRAVASAVKENDVSFLDGVDAPSINLEDDYLEGGIQQDLPFIAVIDGLVARIYRSCHLWLDVYNDNNVNEGDKHRSATIHRFVHDWVTNALCSFGVIKSNWLVVCVRLLLGGQAGTLEKIGLRRFVKTLFWSAKWTAGAVALMCIQMYGQDYSDWLLEGKTGDFAFQGTILSWQVIAYSMSFQFSAEGTLKKGLLRMIGTCLGGLAAWIGLMLCSLSYDGTSPANPFAWIAWLVVCLFVGNFSGKGKGISAFFGMEYNTGFAPFYFLLTLAIVGMEAFYGEYGVNTGVANRVVANLLGIAMAMLVSILPPYYSGKDPQSVFEKSLTHSWKLESWLALKS